MRHAPHVRPLTMAPIVFLFAACANAPVQGSDPDDVPNVAEIVCEADGSTTIRTPQVVVQPDGVHVHAVSHLDEPAELVGLGRDVDPGDTRWVSTIAPGRVEVGCNPFSDHGAGNDPVTRPVELLDPDGLYAEGEVECSGSASVTIADFFEQPMDAGPVPLDVARESIRRLEPTDEVLHVGYPEQDTAGVAVRREGVVVATFSFVTFDGEEWVIEGSEICSSSGLR